MLSQRRWLVIDNQGVEADFDERMILEEFDLKICTVLTFFDHGELCILSIINVVSIEV